MTVLMNNLAIKPIKAIISAVLTAEPKNSIFRESMFYSLATSNNN